MLVCVDLCFLVCGSLGGVVCSVVASLYEECWVWLWWVGWWSEGLVLVFRYWLVIWFCLVACWMVFSVLVISVCK